MKIVKHRNLMGLFFAIFMMLPMIAIGVRCAYITFNKNAKDSYYGETINEYISVEMEEVSDYQPNITYHFIGIQFISDTPIEEAVSNFTCSSLTYNNNTYHNVRLAFYSDGNGVSNLGVFVRDLSTTPSTLVFNGYSQNISLTFEVSSINFTQSKYELISNMFYRYDYNKYSYLDNAFIYSVHEITDNNLGKIDFFSFFANMFLDLNNPKTQTYVNFVNWYFNYMLLVSLAYLLFFVIMWFINYIRQILERGNSLGHGGF